jgi:hypothetical protein
MTKHQTMRQPSKRNGFSWFRTPVGESGQIQYRLFRRDCHNALHISALNVHASQPPRIVAQALRIAKRQLRDKVDEIDLQHLEI